MKNLDLNAIGVVEMNAVEMIRTNGGEDVAYIEWAWHGDNSNELIGLCIAVENVLIAGANAGIWVWNQF